MLRKGIWVVLMCTDAGLLGGEGWREISSPSVFSWPLLPCCDVGISFQSFRRSGSVCQKEAVGLHRASNLKHHKVVGWAWGEAYSCYTACMQGSISLPYCWFLWCICPGTCRFSSKEESQLFSLTWQSTWQDSKQIALLFCQDNKIWCFLQ